MRHDVKRYCYRIRPSGIPAKPHAIKNLYNGQFVNVYEDFCLAVAVMNAMHTPEYRSLTTEQEQAQARVLAARAYRMRTAQ